MEVTVKKVEITLPEVDMALLKELAKKFGWNIGRKKSGIEKGLEDIKAGKAGPIPRELQNVHADGTGFEREQGYLYPHDYPGHWVRQQYLPDTLKDRKYYEYGPNKTEQAAKRYWDELRRLSGEKRVDG